MTNTSIDASAIPAGWEAVRMDKHLHFTKHQVTPDQMADQEVFHYSIPQVQETGTGALEDGSTIDSNKLIIDRDKLLVSRLNPRKATICLASPQKQLTVCSTEFVPVSPTGIDLRFVQYITLSDNYRQRLESLVESATRSHQRVATSDIYKFWWVIPSREIQGEIVDFLDRETAKIDALIDKQEQLIATLREDRATTITHAVTKGLDPNARLRETGAKWVDTIPVNWTLSRFSRHISINSGQVDPRLEQYRDLTLIAPNHVEPRTGKLLEAESAKEQGADSGKYRVSAGQVIYSKIRPNLAKVTIAPVDCLCSADMYGLSTDPNELLSRFLLYELLSQPFTDYVIDSSMRVAMPKVNHDSLGAAPIWFPSIEEQYKIVEFLDARCARIDALIAKSTEMIETLREYRSALITNAVTGKIDMREAV